MFVLDGYFLLLIALTWFLRVAIKCYSCMKASLYCICICYDSLFCWCCTFCLLGNLFCCVLSVLYCIDYIVSVVGGFDCAFYILVFDILFG